MSGPLVFDTVVLSNFALSKKDLDILRTRYGGRGCVTSEVLDEIISGIVAGFSELRKSLGQGEASCIAWAEMNHATVATDDRLAREACRRLKIAFTGTIGILAKSCREGQVVLSEGEAILQPMIAAGFYSPIQRLAEIV